MAFAKYENLSSTEWTLIGNNVSSISFQVEGQNPVYIGFNTSSSVPSEEFGLFYKSGQGELKRTLSDLTYVSNPTHVFARSVTKISTIVVETP